MDISSLTSSGTGTSSAMDLTKAGLKNEVSTSVLEKSLDNIKIESDNIVKMIEGKGSQIDTYA